MLISRILLAGLLSVSACAAAPAQEMSPALKELAAAAGREGALTLSWSQTTLGGSQGAARTRGKGRIEFLGNRFKGLIETRADPPYDIQVTQHLAGKRLGACKFPRKPAPELKPFGGG